MEVSVFSLAHICYDTCPPFIPCYIYIAYNTFRDARGEDSKKINELTEQVHFLVTGYKEFCKTMLSTLENHASGPLGVSDLVYIYSKKLPALNRADFGNIPFWPKAAWSEIRNGSKAADNSEDPILTLFFEDADGNLVLKSEIQAVRNFTRAYFELLWTHKRAPSKWGEAPLDLQIDFIRRIEEEFEFLRYCERHWKAEQIFMNYYPNWYKNKTSPPRTKKKKSSKRARSDDTGDDLNEDGGDENEDDNPKGSKCPCVEETESNPPPTQPGTTATSKRVCSVTYRPFAPANDTQSNPL